MVNYKKILQNESLLKAGFGALTLHGMMIAALALGIKPALDIKSGSLPGDSTQGAPGKAFHAEVSFVPATSPHENLATPSRKTDGKQLETLPLSFQASANRESGFLEGFFLNLRNASQIQPLSEVPPEKMKQKRSPVFSFPTFGKGACPSPTPRKQLEKSDKISGAGGLSLVSKEASQAIPLFNPPPSYPPEARRKKIQGVVLIHILLNSSGGVERAVPLAPRADPVLEEAALKAVRHWRFSSGNIALEVPIEFSLFHKLERARGIEPPS